MIERERLPTEEFHYEGLAALGEHEVHRRRELVFLVLSGFFLGTLAMLNILGITRFIDLGFTVAGQKVLVAVGVLPYPVTFLCTDLISELYGKKRAASLVWMGLALNLWVALILYLGGVLPGFDLGSDRDPPLHLFTEVQAATFAAMLASMIAYLSAQLVDVHVFHFWKRMTQGRHLWLRNNGSTLVSQLVDTTAVILATHFLAGGLPLSNNHPLWTQLAGYILAGYLFKLVAALLDTGPFYLCVRGLTRYLRLPSSTHDELQM